jgi:hypothetical protein
MVTEPDLFAFPATEVSRHIRKEVAQVADPVPVRDRHPVDAGVQTIRHGFDSEDRGALVDAGPVDEPYVLSRRLQAADFEAHLREGTGRPPARADGVCWPTTWQACALSAGGCVYSPAEVYARTRTFNRPPTSGNQRLARLTPGSSKLRDVPGRDRSDHSAHRSAVRLLIMEDPLSVYVLIATLAVPVALILAFTVVAVVAVRSSAPAHVPAVLRALAHLASALLRRRK